MTIPDTVRRSERRLVTCLFADVTGSTHLAETMDPEEWTDIMNRGFTAMIAPIQEYGGHVARLMGDGLLALFGAPTAHEDDPERAVLAGLGIIESIGPLRKELADRGLVFDVRVGINTGMTVVGFVGPEGAADYTAMGDAVNVAARMEQTAVPGTVQISQATHRFVRDAVETESIGGVTVKGKTDPVNSHRVTRRRTSAERRELSTPLVGRDAELGVLREAVDDVRNGIGSVVAVTGQPGIGKSRLIEALHAENDESDEPLVWWQARGSSYDRTRPLSAVVNRTRQLYAVEPGDSREKIKAAVDIAHEDFPDEFRESLVDAIYAGYSARDERRDDEMVGGDLHRQISRAFVGGIRATADVGPAIIVFEDLQWIDAASAALVAEAWRMAGEVAVLFVAVIRPLEQSPAWPLLARTEEELGERFVRLELRPLDAPATRTLALLQLGVDWIPREFETEIHRTSEGNPLFIQELAQSFARHGAIVESDGEPTWNRAFRTEDGAISPTLRSLITSRVDRLDPDARALLQTASVIGHEFSGELLEAVVDDRVADVSGMLDLLLDGGLLTERAPQSQRAFAFRNEMLRQITYESVLKRDRKVLHAAVAEALLAGPDAADAHALAFHYGRAGDDEAAYRYSIEAGEQAVRLSSYADAVTSFRTARDLLPDPPPDPEELLRISTLLGRAYELSGRHSVALDEYVRLEETAVQHGMPAVELAALVHQAVVKATFNEQFDPEGGRSAAERARRRAVELDDDETLAHVEWALMLLDMFGDRDYASAIEHGTTGLALAQVHGTERNLAFLVHDLGRAHMLAGHLVQARELLLEARGRWEGLNDPSMIADTWAMESDIAIMTGDLPGGRHAAEEVIAVATELESDWLQAVAQGNLITIDIEEGRYQTALDRFEAATELARQAGMSELLIQYSAYAALLQGLAGDPAGGIARLDVWDGPPILAAAESQAALRMMQGDMSGALEALHTGRLDHGAPAPMGLHDFYLALRYEVQARAGEPAAALDAALALAADVTNAGRRLVLVDVRYVIGLAQLALGNPADAVTTLEMAEAGARDMGSRRNQWRVAAALAGALETLGRTSEAARHRRTANDVIAEIAAGFPSAESRARFLQLPDVAAVVITAGM